MTKLWEARRAVESIEEEMLNLLRRRQFDAADEKSRLIAKDTYERFVKPLNDCEVFQLIDEITGGLAYRKGDFNIMRMVYCGSIIAWPEAIPDGGRVLEIGTGIGRTCYVAIEWANPSLFVTIDVSPFVLAIALFRNTVSAYREALWRKHVKIVLYDSLKAADALNLMFDHIIHDGGPNPRRNPALYSRESLYTLSKVLKLGGSMSIFAGRDRKWQNEIDRTLKSQGFEVKSASFPDAPTLVFHAAKKNRVLE